MSNYWPTWNFPNCQTGRWTLVFSICGAFSNRGKGLIIKDHVLVSPRVSPQTRRRKSAMRLGLVNFIFVERCMGKNISNQREAHETDPKKKQPKSKQTVRQSDRQTNKQNNQNKQTKQSKQTNKQNTTQQNKTQQNKTQQNTTKHNKTKHNKTTHNKTKHNKTKRNNIKPTNQSINQTNK